MGVWATFTAALAGFCLLAEGRTSWRPLGPYGGSAQFVRVSRSHPEILVAATRRGTLFRSVDRAKEWVRLPRVVPADCVLHALEIHPADADRWFAGFDCEQNPSSGGLYVTADGGRSWTRPVPLRGKGVWSFAIAPSGERLAVGTTSGVFAGYGEIWSRISPEAEVELQPVVSLAYGAADENTLFAGTTHLPWRTTDGGSTWASVHDGMIDDSDVFSIAPVDYPKGVVYASACSGVYRSETGGRNWSRLATPAGAYRAFFVTPDPHRNGVVYAGTSVGLLRSEDDGRRWTTLLEGVVHSIAFDPAVPKRVYAASEFSGILSSSDGGDRFEPSNRGFVNRRFAAFTASGETLLVAGADPEPELFRSTDRGMSWGTEKPWPKDVRFLSSSPDRPGVVFAANARHAYLSRNGGQSWVPVSVPAGGPIRSLAATRGGALAVTDRLYSWSWSSRAWVAVRAPASGPVQSLFTGRDGVVAASTPSTLMLSEDSGASWHVCTPPGNDVNSAALGAGFLLAGSGRGLVRSEDSCRTWKPVRNGLSADTVSLVSIEAGPPTFAFAVQDGRVFLSSDAGQSWSAIDDEGRNGVYPSILHAGALSKELFGLFAGAGILVRSIDSGGFVPDVVGGSQSSRFLKFQGDSR